MSKNADDQAAKLEESAKRIDELMQERASFERTIAELRGQHKDQRKTHQGMMDRTLEFLPLVDNFVF
jgi:hypothetical protein